MALVKKFIFIEDVLKAIFLNFSDSLSNGKVYKPTFKTGDEKEVMKFIKKNDNPYPLIILTHPLVEEHDTSKSIVDIDNLTLLIAVKPRNSLAFNEDSLEHSFRDVLTLVFEQMDHLFRQANTLNSDYKYTISKHFNYGNVDRTKHKTIAVWDVLKVTFNCTINDNCLKLKKIT